MIFMKYGNTLKYLRQELEQTQEQLANYLDISRFTYCHYETEYLIIPTVNLVKLSNYFNVSIDYIFGFTNITQYKKIKKEIDRKIVGERLKNWRKENKLTQKEVANVLNTVQPVITNYENGKNLITTSFLYELCKHYKISADYLLGRIDKKIMFK